MDRSVFAELRDEMIACLAVPDVRLLKDPWRLRSEYEWPVSSSFDADLERYAFVQSTGNIEVRQVEDDRLLARFQGHGDCSRICFSPDGSLLAVTYGDHLSLGQRTNFEVWDW